MRHYRKVLYTLVGCVIAVVLLWALFRGTNWAVLAHELGRVDKRWLLASATAFATANAIRGLRMWPVLSLRQPIRASLVFNTTQISQLANMALPLRGGPVLRALAISKISGRPFSYLAGASFSDRSAEGSVLGVIMLGIAIALFQGVLIPISATSSAVASTMLGLAILCFTTTTVLFLLTRARRGTPGPLAAALARRFAARAHAVWGELREGVRDTLFSRRSAFIWLGAVAAWGGNVLAHALLLRAFGLDAPWFVPVLGSVLAMVTFVLPGSPGLVGPYHAAVIGTLAMGMPETSHELRLAVAIVMHAVHMSIIAALGTVGLLAEHQSLFALEAAEDALDEAPASDHTTKANSTP
jgi:uncharacterized membrane protein YbhN (UPF0104 family)